MPLRRPLLSSTSTIARRAAAAVVAGACCLFLFGCELRGATDYLIAGNEAFQRNDYKQAEVEYRNALR